MAKCDSCKGSGYQYPDPTYAVECPDCCNGFVPDTYCTAAIIPDNHSIAFMGCFAEKSVEIIPIDGEFHLKYNGEVIYSGIDPDLVQALANIFGIDEN